MQPNKCQSFFGPESSRFYAPICSPLQIFTGTGGRPGRTQRAQELVGLGAYDFLRKMANL